MSVAGLIVAAGRGARAGSEPLRPKQYWPIGGVPMLGRAISPFAAHAAIDEILVVIHPDDARLYETAAAPFATRLRAPVAGGATRQDSVRAGLEALAMRAPDYVLIHDAARPFLDAHLIDRVLAGLEAHPAALPCVPVTDTLKRAQGALVTGTLDRAGLMRAQTPQGFRFEAILAAHRAAANAGVPEFTDDAGLAEWFGLEVAVVEGAEANRKLTTSEDLAIADELLHLRGGARQAPEIRVGSGYDVHAFGSGDAVILCGVAIPHHKKLTGHSDADVGLHALTDALLGAIGDGRYRRALPAFRRTLAWGAIGVVPQACRRQTCRARRRDRACGPDLSLRSAAHRALSGSDARERRRDARPRYGPSERQGHDQ